MIIEHVRGAFLFSAIFFFGDPSQHRKSSQRKKRVHCWCDRRAVIHIDKDGGMA